jgi:hypothetical protein
MDDLFEIWHTYRINMFSEVTPISSQSHIAFKVALKVKHRGKTQDQISNLNLKVKLRSVNDQTRLHIKIMRLKISFGTLL